MYVFAKSVQIRSYFWSVFSCIRTEYGDLRCKSPYSSRIQEIYGVNLRIQPEYRKIWTRNITPYLDTLHAVKHVYYDSIIILIAKEKISTNTNKIVEKETSLIGYDEITFKRPLTNILQKR